jgi:hypothetical protein
MTKDSEPNGSKHSLNLFMNTILICKCCSQIFELCHAFKGQPASYYDIFVLFTYSFTYLFIYLMGVAINVVGMINLCLYAI